MGYHARMVYRYGYFCRISCGTGIYCRIVEFFAEIHELDGRIFASGALCGLDPVGSVDLWCRDRIGSAAHCLRLVLASVYPGALWCSRRRLGRYGFGKVVWRSEERRVGKEGRVGGGAGGSKVDGKGRVGEVA